MEKQLDDFSAFVETKKRKWEKDNLSVYEKFPKPNALANEFWLLHQDKMNRAAEAQGEKRGYPDSKTLAQAYRNSK